MNLRKKIYLAIGSASLVLLLLLLGFYFFVVIDDFRELERRGVQEHVFRALASIQGDVGALNGIAGEWAVRDDTYEYMLSGPIPVDRRSGWIGRVRAGLVRFRRGR